MHKYIIIQALFGLAQAWSGQLLISELHQSAQISESVASYGLWLSLSVLRVVYTHSKLTHLVACDFGFRFHISEMRTAVAQDCISIHICDIV